MQFLVFFGKDSRDIHVVATLCVLCLRLYVLCLRLSVIRRINTYLSNLALRYRTIGFYQVRQGRTWSRNYKSPSSSSPPPPSSSPTRFRICSYFLPTFCQLYINFLTNTFWSFFFNNLLFSWDIFTPNFQNYTKFSNLYLIFTMKLNF
jgi:hypothetical protein